MEVVTKTSGHKNMVMKSWLQMDVVAKSLVASTMVKIPDDNYWETPGYMKWKEEIFC